MGKSFHRKTLRDRNEDQRDTHFRSNFGERVTSNRPLPTLGLANAFPRRSLVLFRMFLLPVESFGDTSELFFSQSLEPIFKFGHQLK